MARKPLTHVIDLIGQAYSELSALGRPVTPAVVKLEPRVTFQLETLSKALMSEVNVPTETVNEKGKRVVEDKTVTPFGVGPDLLKSWPHLLKLSDLPDAQKLANLYEAIEPNLARTLPIEAYCYAAGVSPMRVLEILTGIIVRQGATASTLITSMWHPRVVEKTVEMALRDEGVADRAFLHKATGFVPMPKGSATIVNIQQNAERPGQATFVPAPPPESTIRALADTFNEARGLPAVPEFTHAPIDVEAEDEPEDDE